MKATELRIGNHVYRQSDKMVINRNSVYQIEVVTKQTESKYDPIPLTEEWLIKFGFHYSDDDNEFLELELMHKIKLYADNSNNFSTVVLRLKENEIEIKSVHQLQNLYFALTGKELPPTNL